MDFKKIIKNSFLVLPLVTTLSINAFANKTSVEGNIGNITNNVTNYILDNNLISTFEIKNVTTIEDGVAKIIQSVRNYGINEYNKQLEEGVDQPYFWLLKPLNRSATNMVEMFAPNFTKGISMGACYQKLFHQYMTDGYSLEDAQIKAKTEVPNCMSNFESPLEGSFASKVRQMVLCHPKHGQLLLDNKDYLHFVSAMPCHISVYKKDNNIFVSWRNVKKMAVLSNLSNEKLELSEEIQEDMENMLSHLE